ncbi:DUF4872 domain-containing protein [Candidatus Poribacteria bacterium]|nr:DUF4872 domain-containing protein [Candidatus Poribacteria bacterium]
MEKINGIKPYDNCLALDGYHCQTNSLAKMFHHYNCPLSEDMLFGLGAGMGFMYWHQKGIPPFVGGRGNVKEFFQDIGRRTSVKIEEKSTSSEKKAEIALLEKLGRNEPVMVYGDMGFLPWFDLPEGYHFGGHTFVICGYDGENTVLASDMEQKASGLKKGFYYPISLEQLSKARNSEYKPFPPDNTYLEFDFSNYHKPGMEDIYSAIKQEAESMLNPPISNFGIKGIRRTAKEIIKWQNMFNDMELRMNLFSIYIFIEIGGTGGGCFRYMYSRFLKEAAEITSNKELERVASMIYDSGKLLSEMALLFKDAETTSNIGERIIEAIKYLDKVADLEENAFRHLSEFGVI